MECYITKIQEYCEQHKLPFGEIKNKKCIKLVFNLLIHDCIPNCDYDNDIWYFYLGFYYKEQKDYENMKKYWLLAIDKGNSHIMTNLGLYYKEQNDYENMKKYYMLAIDKGNGDAMYKLGYYYYFVCKDYENMMKYYLMAIDKGNDYAMNGLAYYYEEQKDYENMKKYYLMAIDKGNSYAMHNLGYYYDEQNDYENMIKYYLMAIDKGYTDSMYNLGCHYEKLKDYENMKKYYLMAIDKGDDDDILLYDLNTYVEKHFDYDTCVKILKHLNTINKIQLNKHILKNNIKTNVLDICYVCYDENVTSCLKDCDCKRDCICVSCYIKHPKCINCEN